MSAGMPYCTGTFHIHIISVLLHLLWHESTTTRPNELLTKEFMFDTSYMIRAFVFLTVLGMEWPYSLNLVEPEIRAPLGGMTTIEYDSTAEEVPIQWRLTRKITRMIKR
ncbi:hypothetical protein BDF19DRAFT_428095 [Syncephalis fuscata]|nr:hypothetical protein BDF19DRAFT_428095 [Syncephalis fuscata]